MVAAVVDETAYSWSLHCAGSPKCLLQNMGGCQDGELESQRRPMCYPDFCLPESSVICRPTMTRTGILRRYWRIRSTAMVADTRQRFPQILEHAEREPSSPDAFFVFSLARSLVGAMIGWTRPRSSWREKMKWSRESRNVKTRDFKPHSRIVLIQMLTTAYL